MGCSTDLFCKLSFNDKTYNSLDEVCEDIDELQRLIRTCKEEIYSLMMMTEPNKFYNKEDFSTPYDWINYTFRSDFELLEEYYIELYKLQTLEENWDICHDNEGYAIPRPDNIPWDAAYLNGDFVNTTTEKNKNKLL